MDLNPNEIIGLIVGILVVIGIVIAILQNKKDGEATTPANTASVDGQAPVPLKSIVDPKS